MKTCDYCGAQNSDDATVCTSCAQAEFKSDQPALPPDPDPGPDRGGWVTLTNCQSMPEADALVSRLEAIGIQAAIPDEFLMQAVAWNVNTFGFIRVQVAAADLDEAQKLLASAPEDSTAVQQERDHDAEPGIAWAKIPLSWPMRCVAFILPLLLCGGIFVFAVAKGGYERQGFERKADEFTGFFMVGFLFWVIAVTAFGISYSNNHR